MREDEEREERRRRVAGLFDTRAGSVALLIAIVLITQAGLVYVAVDQIGTTDEPTFVQPARNSRSPGAPISVEADPQRHVPAPAATRTAGEVEAESEEPPVETGLDRAREQADPRGVAPPLTGNEPPGADAGQDPPASEHRPSERRPSEQPQSDPGAEPAASHSPSDRSDPHDHQERASEPPAEDQETQHGRHGHGAQDHEPPGQGGDNPGNGSDNGGENGKGKGGG